VVVVVAADVFVGKSNSCAGDLCMLRTKNMCLCSLCVCACVCLFASLLVVLLCRDGCSLFRFVAYLFAKHQFVCCRFRCCHRGCLLCNSNNICTAKQVVVHKTQSAYLPHLLRLPFLEHSFDYLALCFVGCVVIVIVVVVVLVLVLDVVVVIVDVVDVTAAAPAVVVVVVVVAAATIAIVVVIAVVVFVVLVGIVLFAH
jgi:hypothetical protein